MHQKVGIENIIFGRSKNALPFCPAPICTLHVQLQRKRKPRSANQKWQVISRPMDGSPPPNFFEHLTEDCLVFLQLEYSGIWRLSSQ